jgi:hypothetical protein
MNSVLNCLENICDKLGTVVLSNFAIKVKISENIAMFFNDFICSTSGTYKILSKSINIFLFSHLYFRSLRLPTLVKIILKNTPFNVWSRSKFHLKKFNYILVSSKIDFCRWFWLYSENHYVKTSLFWKPLYLNIFVCPHIHCSIQSYLFIKKNPLCKHFLCPLKCLHREVPLFIVIN